MPKIWLTSDTHFGHPKSFLYEPRGYSSIEEHDEDIIRIWNETVSPEDTVYHLGDVMLGENSHGLECLSRLNGNIKIVQGNHDTAVRLALYDSLPNVEVVGWATMIKYKKYNIYLSHYPTIVSNKDNEKPLKAKILGAYGHTHSKEQFCTNIPFSFNVCLDANNNHLILLDDIIEKIKENQFFWTNPVKIDDNMNNKVRECINYLGEKNTNSCFTCVFNRFPDTCDYNYFNINHDCGYYKPIRGYYG